MASAGAYGALASSPLRALLDEKRSSPSDFSDALIGAPVREPDDDRLLDEIERASFSYFWEQMDATTGIVKDRSLAKGSDERVIGSIGATGFGLTGLCIGAMRGYGGHADIRHRVRTALRFYWNNLENKHGFFYHWLDVHTGEHYLRYKVEVSSIDTALFLCGVITCRQYFRDAEIDYLAGKLVNRVDWVWLLRSGLVASMGWVPGMGFLHYNWGSYNELMMIYLLGLGSPTYPLPPETWTAWKRPMFEYEGIRYIGTTAPLFAHQFSHAWFDFRGRRDQFADYFLNSALATNVHRLFCMSLQKQFPDYSDDLWGITASDSSQGYTVWGGPPAIGHIDGTVVPCATGGSVAFLPHMTLPVLRNIKTRFMKQTWSRYGFVDAFNPLTGWFDSDVIGIDIGITMLMAENARSRFVWNTFMKNPEAKRGMEIAGLHPYKAEYEV